MLGQRFAFDLLRVDDRPGINAHPAGTLRGLIIGGRTRECYAWGATVHAPFDGDVITASDGMAERAWLHPVREIAHVLWTAVTFRPSQLSKVLGNHVILRSGDVYAGFAHLVPDSVMVREGQTVRAGEVIGRVGHTGNSTMPHLHFQLMDGPDPLTARAIPCAFRAFDVLRDGRWEPTANGIPGRTDRIRSVEG
jgi:murein DD-endopeptidase MepM/ murein hydrolase activator NlpD